MRATFAFLLVYFAGTVAEAQLFDCLNVNAGRRVVTNTPKAKTFQDCKPLSLSEAAVTYVPSESFGRGVPVTKTPKLKEKAAAAEPSPMPRAGATSLPAALQYDAQSISLNQGEPACQISGVVESISGPACQAVLRVQHRGTQSQFDVAVNRYSRKSQIHQGDFRRTMPGACGDTVKIEIVSCLSTESNVE